VEERRHNRQWSLLPHRTIDAISRGPQTRFSSFEAEREYSSANRR
jgi:hypothetical protein